MLRIALVFLLAGISVVTMAAEQSANPPAVVNRTAGQPVTMVFSDGRQADLKIVHADSEVVSQKIEITSSDCGSWGMSCNYKFSMRRFWVALIWTKHPDASKIGQIVKRGYKGSNGESSFSELKSDTALTSGLLPNSGQKIANTLPSHQLQCTDFSWLPTGTKEAPALQRFTRWDQIDNSLNKETGMNENRPTGGVQELNMVRVTSDTLQIASVGRSNGVVRIFDILTLAPVLDLAVAQPDGGICQASLSTHGIGDILPVYDGLESKHPAFTDVPTYVYGQDEILNMATIKNDIENWFQQEMVEYE
jgi:hypothetical protein